MIDVVAAVAGVQKCGTTALLHMLTQHPQLLTHKTRQWPYFLHQSDYCDVWPSVSQDFFPEPEGGKKYVVCDISLSHYELALERFVRLFPQAKVILTVRDPADRAYSAFCFAKTKGRERRMSFDDVLQNVDAPELLTVDDQLNFGYVELGYYSKTYERMRKHLDKDSIAVVTSSGLKNNPVEECSRLFAFLGLPEYAVTPIIANTAYVPRWYFLQRLSRSNSWWKKILKRCLPVVAKHNLIRTFDSLNRSSPNTRNAPLRDDQRDFLNALYSTDLKKFKHKTGIDL